MKARRRQRTDLGQEQSTLESNNEQCLRALLDAITESLIVVDIEGTIKMINRIGAARLGGDSQRLLGLKLHELGKDVFPPSVLRNRLKRMKRALCSGKADRFTDERCGRVYDNSIYPVLDHQGHVAAIAVFATDITESIHNQRKLEDYRDEVMRARRLASIGAASASLVHQLRQPLSALGLSIDNALAAVDGSCPPRALTSLRCALTEISRATEILHAWQIQLRSSPGTGSQNAEIQKVAEQVVQVLDESAWRACVTVRLKDLRELPRARISEMDLQQVFYALIENSIEAADGAASRKLEVSGTAEADHVELRFADDCGGIAPEHLGRLFEPFFGTRDPDQGAGLGLSIVRHIVSQAGGEIRVESEFGQGATFLVSLPVAEGEGMAHERTWSRLA